MPRVEYAPDERSRRLPHGEWYNYSIIGYCAPCDEKIQRDLPPCLSERCDCDQYKRWICLPCKMDEDRLDERYFATRTRLYWDERDEWDSNLLDGLMIDEVLEQRAVSYIVLALGLSARALNHEALSFENLACSNIIF